MIPIGERTLWSRQSSSVVTETVWKLIGCRGGGSKNVSLGYSDASRLLLGKEEQSPSRVSPMEKYGLSVLHSELEVRL